MATLWITEFSVEAASGFGSKLPAAKLPALAEQAVTFTTSTPSAAFASGTTFIRVQASAACYLKVGANPTATASNMPLAGGVAEYFGVKEGDKIAALAA